MATLAVAHLSVSIAGTPVVNDVSLTLPSATVTVLMGPNGSGKSTFANALMGHPRYAVDRGTVRLNGEDITGTPPHEKARHGLFLSPQRVPDVAGTTLGVFLHRAHTALTGERTDPVAFYSSLRETAHAYGIPPHLLDRPLSAGLSGGERKLSEALQLAVLRPAVAILDEIDAGVDVDALAHVFHTVERLRAEGTAFLIISHHPSLSEHLEPKHVHVMARGTLVRSGGDELMHTIQREGFCNVLECPLVKGCDAKPSSHEQAPR